MAWVFPWVSLQQPVPDLRSTRPHDPMGLPIKTSPKTSKMAQKWRRYTQFWWILRNWLYLPQFWSKKYVFGLVWKLMGRDIVTCPRTRDLHGLPKPMLFPSQNVFLDLQFLNHSCQGTSLAVCTPFIYPIYCSYFTLLTYLFVTVWLWPYFEL